MASNASFFDKLAALEDSSRRLAATDFSSPRLYSALLLENQAIPVRNAKPFEQNLFVTNGLDSLINMKAREGVDEFEASMQLAAEFNEICQNEHVRGRLDQVRSAHEDVLSSISKLSTQIAELAESNSASDSQEPTAVTEGNELMTDIEREEGEIFALEQLLSEKRQLLGRMQEELDDLGNLPESGLAEQEQTMVEDDPELEAETAQKKLEIEYLDQKILEQRQMEQDQMALYQSLLQESEALAGQQQDARTMAEENSSPAFEEVVRLWNKVNEQRGDTVVEPRGIKEAYLKLERLLDNLERCQRHVIMLDVLHCADPAAAEFDPPRSDSVILAARTLQLIIEEGGTYPLQELKDQVSREATQQGAEQELGIQAVYSLVASHLIEINRNVKPNLVSLT
ncbi:hypothetical protein BGZ98_006644 [Dissophora globulifera]|nr:hypothetical protein BGZ98_006644 [Dissophora globulifera]